MKGFRHLAKGTIKDGARAMPFTDMADPYETGQRPILIISIAAFTLSLACVLLFGAQGDWSKG